VNESVDSMTVIIVNRDMSAAHNVTVGLNGFSVTDGSYKTLQLSSLPANETFKSHTNNALKANSVTVSSNSLSITVPALSTTAVILKSSTTGISDNIKQGDGIEIFPNPANNQLRIRINRSQAYNSPLNKSQNYILLNSFGQTVSVGNLEPGTDEYTINIGNLSGGLYFIRIDNEIRKFIIQH
jgi:hypothetical protein